MQERIVILTDASFNHGNLNIRVCGRDFFPPDIYGKSSRASGLGKQVTLKADGLDFVVKTDIPIDKESNRPRWLFRERSWLRKFVNRHNLAPGDRVILRRVSDLTYTVTPEKKMNSKKITAKSFRKTKNPKVVSLFSGCGGLDLGFHKEGYKVKWANDNNKWAVEPIAITL